MKFLRHWRKKAGLTQAELGDLTKIHSNTIARYERNELTPSVETAQTLAKALHVSEAELLNGPQSKEISVTLKIGKLEEMNNMVIDMNNTNGFGLILDTAKGVGIAGIAQFDTEDQLEETITKIARLLRKGWKTQQED